MKEGGNGEAIVVLPARGGSKRYPRKNIALLDGKPLLSYAIRAARKAATIAEVYVSTEDQQIAEVAEKYGASVPYLRPESLAGDFVTADDAVAHLVRFVQNELGRKVSIVVLIQPTSPFVKAEHIDAAVLKLQENPGLDSVTTMTELDHRNHPYNLALMEEENSWEFIFAKERAEAKSRQSKPAAYKFGNLFAARATTMLSTGRFGPKKGAVLIESVYSWDIDYELDLQLAEFMIKQGMVDLQHKPFEADDMVK